MNKLEKMLTLIAARPQIRTVEIADILDCDIDQVQPALQPHIDRGDLLLTKITAPNGRPANALTATRQFLGSELYQRLSPAIAEWCRNDAAGAGAPVAEARQATPLDKAIALIAAHGSATAPELRVAMGLAPAEYPSTFLQPALQDGRIRRIGRNYFSGAASVPADALPAAEPVPAGHNVPPLRFGFWSDGAVEIQRHGRTALILAPNEWAALQAARGVALEVAQ